MNIDSKNDIKNIKNEESLQDIVKDNSIIEINHEKLIKENQSVELYSTVNNTTIKDNEIYKSFVN